MKKRPVKYIFVLGGVLSGLGKGIVSASLGYLFKSLRLKVTIQKLDPYLNIDPGTMNPYQHGEVFVLDDGSETDLDLGHYERFINENLSEKNTTSSGRIYWDVLSKERQGDYLGETIQVIPHITDEIIDRIKSVNPRHKYDVVITEVGGTVGDIEGQPFMEAIRQLCLKVGYENSLIIHLTLLPYISAAGEIKTKPTQHSVMLLREIGLQPDLLVCRTENNHHLTQKLKKKLGLFCNMDVDHVFESPDVETIYEIPLILYKQGMDTKILKRLKLLELTDTHHDVQYLEKFVHRYKNPEGEVTIAICGKYNSLHDAYKSILEAFIHAGVENKVAVKIKWVDTEALESQNTVDFPEEFKDVDGILIPGGFGNRGIEGKIKSAGIARKYNIPFFGICLGLQCAIIEFARAICDLPKADSTEFKKRTSTPVIDLMHGQKKVKSKGATMRLGEYSCEVKPKTKVHSAYKKRLISERHRHRYEVNNEYRQLIEDQGMIVCGINKDLDLVEMIELSGHPWYVGVQFHPELKSRVIQAHPLFRDFIAAAKIFHDE
ncbi:MAG: CTP synthase [Candidatus Marinimicrobia bacterium]|nr:CTP synthase [Candidatus Neomarinimicrobiota bacterium]MBT3683902.1 CTP synthase [Candidatus Neomarinimicrobiota bacterium]MBT3896872.1 CTP synthase [Candidatus Neomarinimicrobiota bacterium]MBT4172895.1 CTP synthase [Candidatus Neomarinimicrobiota bacterium]MBT4538531.1 CTP synthase [Candidatus Neomarinimicrobiota bacterium]